MAASAASRQLINSRGASSQSPSRPQLYCVFANQLRCFTHDCRSVKCAQRISCRKSLIVVKASLSRGSPVFTDEDGVQLGTMRLPYATDLQRFESLLFQWANSLCQGAMLPLPVPLKVDKIPGGARLGFITMDDTKTSVLVYIDCLVFPGIDGFAPIFRAIRNGPARDKVAPGEERIMKSMLGALRKCVEIAAA